jgi:hypothetical protein
MHIHSLVQPCHFVGWKNLALSFQVEPSYMADETDASLIIPLTLPSEARCRLPNTQTDGCTEEDASRRATGARASVRRARPLMWRRAGVVRAARTPRLTSMEAKDWHDRAGRTPAASSAPPLSSCDKVQYIRSRFPSNPQKLHAPPCHHPRPVARWKNRRDLDPGRHPVHKPPCWTSNLHHVPREMPLPSSI